MLIIHIVTIHKLIYRVEGTENKFIKFLFILLVFLNFLRYTSTFVIIVMDLLQTLFCAIHCDLPRFYVNCFHFL